MERKEKRNEKRNEEQKEEWYKEQNQCETELKCKTVPPWSTIEMQNRLLGNAEMRSNAVRNRELRHVLSVPGESKKARRLKSYFSLSI